MYVVKSPENESECMMKGMTECSGKVGRGICEEHSRLIFQIALR